jgi:alkaline phosphatase
MGGGRTEFLPNNTNDEEGNKGRRADGDNLISRWESDKKERNVTFKYVWNREQLLSLDNETLDYTLGE